MSSEGREQQRKFMELQKHAAELFGETEGVIIIASKGMVASGAPAGIVRTYHRNITRLIELMENNIRPQFLEQLIKFAGEHGHEKAMLGYEILTSDRPADGCGKCDNCRAEEILKQEIMRNDSQ